MAEQQNQISDNEENFVNLPIIGGMQEGHDAYVIGGLAKENFYIHVARDEIRMHFLANAIAFFYPEIEILQFPAWDCLPYDRVSPSTDIIGARIATLTRLMNDPQKKGRIVLTTLNAITQKLPPKKILSEANLFIRQWDKVSIDSIQNYLVQNGFNRTDTVREPGEFAVRGGLIDLYAASSEYPVRIDLFGDEVETIRSFDPLSQRTLEDVKEIRLNPVSEVFFNEDTIRNFRTNYRAHFGTILNEDPLYESVSAGHKHAGMEHWLPLFYDEMSVLFDYIPAGAVVSADYQFMTAFSARAQQIQDFYQSRLQMQKIEKKQGGAVYNPVPIESLFIGGSDFSNQILSLNMHEISPFRVDGGVYYGGVKGKDFLTARNGPEGQKTDLYNELKNHINHLILQKKKVYICAYSYGSMERLKNVLNEHNVGQIIQCDRFSDFEKLPRSQIGIGILKLENGFENDHFAFISEQDILGDRLARSVKRKKNSDLFITEVSSLTDGDLVVHIEHGIGRFHGLLTLNVDGRAHDCVMVEYNGGDKLYVPVENIEVLSRYGNEETAVQLDRLGGVAWQSRKAKAKKDLMAMADELLKIAAARLLKKSDAVFVEDGVYQEFAARFPYPETDDQLSSIESVLADMTKGHAMDRLVCGDVGFGKTEVALRAAFVAAMAGYQVAVIVPTTLLARQHYQEFTRRFQGWPIKIGQLSRLMSAKEMKQTKDGLKSGDVQVAIGTHALLAKDVGFSNLALLVVDEEQKFGVKQKEKLKNLKDNVHVLTLTATPIPRTLQLSLTGVKDLSLITTPPIDRLAVRTFVMPFDPVIIREALMRENYRGGQSFYVCPRISDLDEVAEKLAQIVPELKVIKAHGQMPPNSLEQRMAAFYEGQYDVLLATNIIESGLDIPNANTMVVHRAELFGLAQLYQIRGRIGRAKNRGYAYLTHSEGKILNKKSKERLHVLETLDTLGAGFQLASHDMDIRGAGNLLGEDQSGHVREVGIELYQKMLEDAVEAARSGQSLNSDLDITTIQDKDWVPQINLGTSVLLPEAYIPDLNVRLSIYRRIADLVTENEIDAFAEELMDRFGALPEEVSNLLDVIRIKQLCKMAHVEKLDAGPKGATLSFRNNEFKHIERLIEYIGKQAGSVRLRPNDQKLVYIRIWVNREARVKGVREILQDLVALAV